MWEIAQVIIRYDPDALESQVYSGLPENSLPCFIFYLAQAVDTRLHNDLRYTSKIPFKTIRSEQKQQIPLVIEIEAKEDNAWQNTGPLYIKVPGKKQTLTLPKYQRVLLSINYLVDCKLRQDRINLIQSGVAIHFPTSKSFLTREEAMQKLGLA